MVRLAAPEQREYMPLRKGHHYVRAELNEMVFFLRPEKVIPLAAAEETTGSMDFTKIELLCNVSGEAGYTLYNDDGFTKEFENPAHYTTIAVRRENGRLIAEQSGAKLALTVTDVKK